VRSIPPNLGNTAQLATTPARLCGSAEITGLDIAGLDKDVLDIDGPDIDVLCHSGRAWPGCSGHEEACQKNNVTVVKSRGNDTARHRYSFHSKHVH